MAQNLQNHTDMHSIDSRDLEVVNELDDGFPVGVRGVAVSHTSQQFDLVQSRLSVMRSALHHFQRHKTLLLQIPAEPDGGKVSPAQFPDHVVPPVKQITNIHRVVSTFTVI